MTAMTDAELLQQYAQSGSQEAFAELVSHHSDWIYSAALRLVRRRDWAEDVTQAVFILLAQRAKNLTTPTLNGWLFKVTRYCASNILREENRRQKRERQAAIMNDQTREAAEDSKWNEMAPILEQTVERLRSADREVVLLRFYQQKSMSEVGEALGISEDAARKRVAKAVEKLRSFMSMRGILLPVAGTAITLLCRAHHARRPNRTGGFLPARRKPHKRGQHRPRRQSNALRIEVEIRGVDNCGPVVDSCGSLVWPARFGRKPTHNARTFCCPATPSAPVVSAEVDDAAITPFYNSLTQIIVSVNFSQIDLDALAAEEKKLLAAATNPNDPRRASIEQNVARSLAMITRTSRAGQRPRRSCLSNDRAIKPGQHHRILRFPG